MKTTRYIDDILSQPEALSAALGGFDAETLGSTVRRIETGAIDRIVVTGMGGSYFAGYPAWLLLAAAGSPAWWVEASELVHHVPALVTPKTLLWILSQSGRSAEIRALLDLVRQAKRAPACILATTNDGDGPLAQQADLTLLLNAGSEHTVATRTFLNTLAVTQLAALALASQPLQAAQRDLRHSLEAVQAYLAAWKENLDQIARTVGAPERLVIVGRGLSLASALAGALVIKEAAKFNAEGMSAAQFRHGPLELADPRLTVLVLEGEGEAGVMNRRLMRDLLGYRAQAVWLSAQTDRSLPGVCLPEGSGPGLPIAQIVPLQLLSVHLALSGGFEPGAFRHSGKVTLTE